MVGGHPGTREDDVAEDVRGDDLVRMLDFEPVGVGGDEHQRVALVLASEDAVERCVAGIGDERLAAGDHQLVAVALDGRRDRLEVGSHIRLGQRERRDRVQRADGGKPSRTDRLPATTAIA